MLTLDICYGQYVKYVRKYILRSKKMFKSVRKMTRAFVPMGLTLLKSVSLLRTTLFPLLVLVLPPTTNSKLLVECFVRLFRSAREWNIWGNYVHLHCTRVELNHCSDSERLNSIVITVIDYL